MGTCWKFDNPQDFVGALFTLDVPALRGSRWAKRGESIHYLQIPVDPGTDGWTSGAVAVNNGEIPDDELLGARESFLRIRPQVIRAPGRVTEPLYIVIPATGPVHLDLLADELSLRGDFDDVTVEAWSVDGEDEPCCAVRIQPSSRGAALPSRWWSGTHLVRELGGDSGLFLALNRRHPLESLAPLLFGGEPDAPGYLRRAGDSTWEGLRARSSGTPLVGVISFERWEHERVVEQAATDPRLEARAPLSIVRDPRPDHERAAIAEKIYMFDDRVGSLPRAFLDLMDETQAGAVSLEYVCVPHDVEDENPILGARHYVRARDVPADLTINADAEYSLCEGFRAAGRNVFVQSGHRFSPYLERMAERGQLSEAWLEDFSRRVGCEDAETAVLVLPAERGSQPRVTIVPPMKPLEEAVEVVFSHWNPTLEKSAWFEGKFDASAQRELSADRTMAAIEEAEQEVGQRAAELLEECGEGVDLAEEQLNAARQCVQGIEAIANAATEAEAKARDGWEELFRSVKGSHQELLSRHEAWAESAGNEIRQGLSAAESTREAAERSIEELAEQLTEAESRERALRELREEAAALVSTARERVEKLTNGLRETEVALRASVQELGETQAAVHERHTAFKQKHDQLGKDHRQLTQQLDALEASLLQLRERQAEVDAKAEAVARATEEQERRKRKLEDDKAALPGLSEKLAGLRARVAELEPVERERETVERELASAQETYRERKRTRDELVQRRDVLRRRIAKAEDRLAAIRRLKEDYPKLQSTVQDLERRLEELAPAEKKLHAAAERERALSAKAETLEAARDELRRRVASVDRLRASVESLEREIGRLQGREAETLPAARRQEARDAAISVARLACADGNFWTRWIATVLRWCLGGRTRAAKNR